MGSHGSLINVLQVRINGHVELKLLKKLMLVLKKWCPNTELLTAAGLFWWQKMDQHTMGKVISVLNDTKKSSQC